VAAALLIEAGAMLTEFALTETTPEAGTRRGPAAVYRRCFSSASPGPCILALLSVFL
jgi:hypothetical protein